MLARPHLLEFFVLDGADLRPWIVAQGGWTIRLAVQEQNPAALRFWNRQGFVEVGAAVQELDDRTNQVRRMELRL